MSVGQRRVQVGSRSPDECKWRGALRLEFVAIYLWTSTCSNTVKRGVSHSREMLPTQDVWWGDWPAQPEQGPLPNLQPPHTHLIIWCLRNAPSQRPFRTRKATLRCTRPPIVSGKHTLSGKIVKAFHEDKYHVGKDFVLAHVRQHILIISGREVVKRVHIDYVPCRRFRTIAPFQMMIFEKKLWQISKTEIIIGFPIYVRFVWNLRIFDHLYESRKYWYLVQSDQGNLHPS